MFPFDVFTWGGAGLGSFFWVCVGHWMLVLECREIGSRGSASFFHRYDPNWVSLKII